MHDVEALFYDRTANGAVVCGLCHHRCTIPNGGSGFCRVRKNTGGTLYAVGYGKCSAVNIDPIEKKPLYHFHPGSKILSVGGYGCNLRCPFCQNHEISMVRNNRRSGESVPDWRGTEVILPEVLARYAKSKAADGNIGMAFTYNEPAIGIEYVLDCARLIHSAGLFNALVTNGSISREALEALLPLTDAMNIDVKSFKPGFYKNLGGDLQTVIETVTLSSKYCHVEVTTLIIPEENDSVGEIEDLARWLASVSPDIPLHLTRFFPKYKYSERDSTPKEMIWELKSVAERYCKYVYAGNMR